MRKLLALATLILSGCYSAPQLVTGPVQGADMPCTGLEPSCRSMSVHISIEKDPSVKLSKSELKRKKSSVFGRCELLVETPQHTVSSYPCTELRLSLQKPTGEERDTWLQGGTFEIAELTRGPYSFSAYSDQYMTGGSKDKINPGQPLRIEIRLRPAEVKSATAM